MDPNHLVEGLHKQDMILGYDLWFSYGSISFLSILFCLLLGSALVFISLCFCRWSSIYFVMLMQWNKIYIWDCWFWYSCLGVLLVFWNRWISFWLVQILGHRICQRKIGLILILLGRFIKWRCLVSLNQSLTNKNLFYKVSDMERISSDIVSFLWLSRI